MLLSGRGAKRDEIMAVQRIRRAAEQGHANAQNELGINGFAKQQNKVRRTPGTMASSPARHQRRLVLGRIEEVAGSEVVAEVAQQAALAWRAALEQRGVGGAEILGPHEHLGVIVEVVLRALPERLGAGPCQSACGT